MKYGILYTICISKTCPHTTLHNNIPEEDTLLTEKAHDGETAFFMTIHPVNNPGPRGIKVKVDPNTQANTIPFSNFKTLSLPFRQIRQD